jgi:hypothetical protein
VAQTNVLWQIDVPGLSDAADLQGLHDGLVRQGVEARARPIRLPAIQHEPLTREFADAGPRQVDVNISSDTFRQ